MTDPEPELRIVDEEAEKVSSVVRLRSDSAFDEPVEIIISEEPPEDPAARLEKQKREAFEGRSVQPGVEAILEQEPLAETIEQPWGIQDGKLAGVPYGWFVLIVALVLGAGVWAVTQMQRGEKEVARIMETTRAITDEEEEADRQAAMLVRKIERTLADYLAADTLEKITPLVRHPERVLPLIEKSWKDSPPVPREFVRMSLFQPMPLKEGNFWVIAAEVREGGTQSLIVEEFTDGQVKVDWETHVYHQPMPWDRFLEERPTADSLEFRVLATPETLYRNEFADASRWRCYLLTARDGDEEVYGYAAAGSPAARALDEALATARGMPLHCILRLHFPAGLQAPDAVVIEKFVEPRWLRGRSDDSP